MIIDDFSDGDVTVEVDYDNSSNSATQTGLDTSTVIGGMRKIALNLDLGQPGDVGSATIDTATQTLHMQATTPDGFERCLVGWADPIDPSTSLNTDLLADGANAFQIDVVSLSGGFFFHFLLRSGFDEGAIKEDRWSVRLPLSDVPYFVEMPFSLFPDVDFTDIDFIAFYGSPPALSFTLDAIRTVPEPSTLVAFILGFGIMWMRQKQTV